MLPPMEPEKATTTFNGAVRLGARVPMLGSLLVLSVLAFLTASRWDFVDAALRDAPVASAQDVLIGRSGPVRVRVDVVVPKTPLTPAGAIPMVTTGQELVAIAGPASVQPGRAIWGQLRPLRPEEREPLRIGQLQTPDAGLPRLVLDTTGLSRRDLLGLVGAGVLLALLAIVVLVRAIGVAQLPLRSAAGRALARLGDPIDVRDALDADLATEHTITGRLHATARFLAFRTTRGFSVLRREDVMWVRQRTAPDPAFLSVIALPVLLFRRSGSRSLSIYERSGRRLRVMLSSKAERNAVLEELEKICPHTIFEDDEPTQNYWKRHRMHFVHAVDERRAQIEAARALPEHEVEP